MKRSILRIAALSLLAVLASGMPALSRADDAGAKTPPAASDPPASQPAKAGPAKFYGVISAVDPEKMTFTLDKVTYTVIHESQMTKASDDSKATLADAVVGEPARGTYTKAADGTLNVTKVRFGKKAGGGKGGKSGKKKSDAAATQASSS